MRVSMKFMQPSLLQSFKYITDHIIIRNTYKCDTWDSIINVTHLIINTIHNYDPM